VLLVALVVAAPLASGGARAQSSASGSSAPVTPVPPAVVPASESVADGRLYYVAARKAMLFNRPDSSAPVGTLPVHAPVHRVDCASAWCEVRTDDGRRGYVYGSAISNVWIRVSKRERRVYLYRGPIRVGTYKADFGYNAFSDKKRRGNTVQADHWRTPEGVFHVIRKNPRSKFYKALVLNYPTAADAERGLEKGIISRGEYRSIVRAHANFEMPPMNTELGGWVEIHGDGTGAATNWTRGCVAVTNADMNELWARVKVGTPVLIE
jgi:lipoprotein-anchoring transpeptidase ErfK/SrfK